MINWINPKETFYGSMFNSDFDTDMKTIFDAIQRERIAFEYKLSERNAILKLVKYGILEDMQVKPHNYVSVNSVRWYLSQMKLVNTVSAINNNFLIGMKKDKNGESDGFAIGKTISDLNIDELIAELDKRETTQERWDRRKFNRKLQNELPIKQTKNKRVKI